MHLLHEKKLTLSKIYLLVIGCAKDLGATNGHASAKFKCKQLLFYLGC